MHGPIWSGRSGNAVGCPGLPHSDSVFRSNTSTNKQTSFNKRTRNVRYQSRVTTAKPTFLVRCRPLQSPGPSSASTLSPGCAPSAPVGSMGFVTENSGVASAALTHAVFDRPLFQQCFEQVAASQSRGARPFVVVYAHCKGSCNMTAEDRRNDPSRSSRPRKGGFDPAQGLTEALKDLVSKHKYCFHPAITELTWDLLNSSWQPGPSASSSQPSEPTAVVCAAPVTPADSCSDPSTATTQQGAQILGVDVVLPDTSDDSEMPNTEQQFQARPHLGGRLLRLISAA